ncbi:translation initiation factor IF-2 N-terminal domain-containing protein, partial [Patescibacteria group bacterium]|nr:translation initiation factor IF-2 N-terminal domain-containing protein [Patescibacteria group bacterium]
MVEENNNPAPPKIVEIPPVIRISDLAELLNIPVTEVIRCLLKDGVLSTINDNIDFETAAIVADDFGFEATEVTKTDHVEEVDEEQGEIAERPPIVIVMGHVDHGKTSLLDYIRKTKVTEKESGGITQRISSYQIKYKDKIVTLLDTPGHEAFSAIRAQGAKVTDVMILVVAAEEGIKPQTIEAIQLAAAANLPVVVAATKIDKPGANLE